MGYTSEGINALIIYMNDDLSALRLRINELDRVLIETLSKRREAIERIGEIKKMHGMDALDVKRWQEVFATRLAWAKEVGVEESLVKDVFGTIHAWSIGIQNGQRSKKSHENHE